MKRPHPGGPSSVVLAGLESAGKSALFRGLTGDAGSSEANFRGSTIMCRKCHMADCGCDLVDTPGIRLADDATTTRLALDAMREADVVLLVARGTHIASELETLLRELDLQQKRTALAITFRDKAPEQIKAFARNCRESLGIPVVIVNARKLDAPARQNILRAIEEAKEIPQTARLTMHEEMPVIQPRATWFEHRPLGPVLAVLCMALMFVVPVYAAHVFAAGAQPVVDAAVITPLKNALAWLPALPQALLLGGYGLITLGWYSFLWAFPVVALISLSVALAEETGLKDRITAALDPVLKKVGLNGRDLIPVLTGFGCNVVAVFQSRACPACTRKSCVSLISFGSACSYQIGASLSLFSASGRPGLLMPYLVALIVVGALHTRLWHGAAASRGWLPLHERAFLQWPSWRAVRWRVGAGARQFLLQAMPIFLLICVVAAAMEHYGIISQLSAFMVPVMSFLRLPTEAAPAVLFSILRKDGLLTLNSDDGALLATLSQGQLFVLVWLASTFSACLVTLWTVRREVGIAAALQLTGRQVSTSLVTTWVLAAFLV